MANIVNKRHLFFLSGCKKVIWMLSKVFQSIQLQLNKSFLSLKYVWLSLYFVWLLYHILTFEELILIWYTTTVHLMLFVWCQKTSLDVGAEIFGVFWHSLVVFGFWWARSADDFSMVVCDWQGQRVGGGGSFALWLLECKFGCKGLFSWLLLTALA